MSLLPNGVNPCNTQETHNFLDNFIPAEALSAWTERHRRKCDNAVGPPKS